jgi:hypothetical protein
LLISHAVLVGLTPLIPVPIVDDLLKTYLERRLTREIAALSGVTLSEGDVKAIAEGPGEGVFAQLGRGALLLPVRLFFRKIFFVLEIKRASDAASATYHRGYLIDAAFAAGARPPSVDPGHLRAAIDATLAESPHSPIGGAIGIAFDGSKSLLRQALGAMIGAIKAFGGVRTEQEVAEAVEDTENKGVVGSLTDRVRRAVETVPEAWFVEIESRLLNKLGRGLR